MSQSSQPSAVISARLIGRNGAALPGCTRWRGQDIRGLSATARVFMAAGIGLRACRFNRLAARRTQKPPDLANFRSHARLGPGATGLLGRHARLQSISILADLATAAHFSASPLMK